MFYLIIVTLVFALFDLLLDGPFLVLAYVPCTYIRVFIDKVLYKKKKLQS